MDRHAHHQQNPVVLILSSRMRQVHPRIASHLVLAAPMAANAGSTCGPYVSLWLKTALRVAGPICPPGDPDIAGCSNAHEGKLPHRTTVLSDVPSLSQAFLDVNFLVTVCACM